jgi:hypothetical protein
VKLLSFEAAKAISQCDSRGATIGGIAKCSGDIRLSVLELEAEGVVGMHEPACPQLLIVVPGSGWVRGGEGDRLPIAQGQAACWGTGELHESATERGLTAIVVEAESLELL